MTLFKGIARDKTNADIEWMNNQSAFYSYGYRSAAEKLINEYDKTSMPEKDAMVFPTIFLYRHYLEIEIKDLIYRSERCSEITPSEITHHRLLDIWNTLDEKYSELSKKIHKDHNFCSAEDKNKVKRIIEEFNKIDEQSFAFRYPRRKNGDKSIKNISHISLNNFKTEIDRVIHILDHINETICHYETYLDNTSS